jgi:hypothetical protein
MPRKRLRYLCHASHHGRRIAGPHQDPNEVERLAWAYLRQHIRRYYDEARRTGMKAEREVSHVGGVRLIVRGGDGFPVEIVLLEMGLFEVEE